MVSGGVLVIWQGDMLVGLPGGPSPVLRMNFIHPHQSYLVTPMQWVMWAAVKIKIVYVFGAKAQTLTLISYYENWCENGLPQFWSGNISFFQFTYHNGRFRGRKKPIFRQTQISYQVGETYIYIYPVFIAGFITSIWKKVYPVYQSWSIYAQYPHCICIALHSHIGSHGGEIRGLLVVPHIGCVWHLCLGWGWG